MDRPSILFVSFTYIPVLGGTEVEVQRVCVGLRERGYEVLVLTAGGFPMPAVPSWTDPVGVPVRILTRRSRHRWREIWFALQVSWILWRDRGKYDVVYFVMQGLHLLAGLPVARLARKPIVMKFVASQAIDLVKQSRVGPLELSLLRKWAFRVLILNDDMVREAIEVGFRPEQLVWMPNPVDTNEFRPGRTEEVALLRARFGISNNVGVAIYTGRFSLEKGLDCLIRGFASAARLIPDTVLILLGDGALQADLEALGVKLGLRSDQLRFPGRVSNREVSLWLRASDIFALVSAREGLSCALTEAMSSGLPSIVSRIPGNTQLINEGMQGLIVPINDEASVGNAFLKLFQDPGIRRRMGQSARKRIVENYTPGGIIDRYETLFAEAVNYQRLRAIS